MIINRMSNEKKHIKKVIKYYKKRDEEIISMYRNLDFDDYDTCDSNDDFNQKYNTCYLKVDFRKENDENYYSTIWFREYEEEDEDDNKSYSIISEKVELPTIVIKEPETIEYC